MPTWGKILADAASAVDKRLAEAEEQAADSADPRAAIRRVRQDVYGIFDA